MAVITGIGVVSPLGHSAEELARRWAAGERARGGADGVLIEPIPFDAVPADVRARSGRFDRICRLFVAATFAATRDAGLDTAAVPRDRLGLSFGTGLGCLLSDAEFYAKVVEQGAAAASPRVFAYTVSSAAAGELSIALGIHGPNLTSHAGLTAGLAAIGYGADLIALGKADLVLAGGADANGAPVAEALRDMGLFKAPDAACPFVDAVPGVWPAEGAAVMVLERADHARARGAGVRGRLAGWAAGFEPTLTGREPQPHGIAETLRRALAASGVAAHELGVVIASAHGTPLDRCERQAIADALGEISPDRLLAPKQALGETFGASGPLALALAIGQRTLRPALISSVCYSGNVAALVVTSSGLC